MAANFLCTPPSIVQLWLLKAQKGCLHLHNHGLAWRLESDVLLMGQQSRAFRGIGTSRRKRFWKSDRSKVCTEVCLQMLPLPNLSQGRSWASFWPLHVTSYPFLKGPSTHRGCVWRGMQWSRTQLLLACLYWKPLFPPLPTMSQPIHLEKGSFSSRQRGFQEEVSFHHPCNMNGFLYPAHWVKYV